MRSISFSGMLDADSKFEWIQYCESGDGKHIISITVLSILFLFSVSFDTSVIIIVSEYQEKKVTAVDFIAVFVRKYTRICAYIRILLPMFSFHQT